MIHPADNMMHQHNMVHHGAGMGHMHGPSQQHHGNMVHHQQMVHHGGTPHRPPPTLVQCTCPNACPHCKVRVNKLVQRNKFVIGWYL